MEPSDQAAQSPESDNDRTSDLSDLSREWDPRYGHVVLAAPCDKDNMANSKSTSSRSSKYIFILNLENGIKNYTTVDPLQEGSLESPNGSHPLD